MKKSKVEMVVGLFVLIGILCIGYLTIQLGELDLIRGDDYRVFARFQSVTGLKVGAAVEMSGVQIGEVEEIALDRERLLASVELKINKGIELTDDVIASVKTSGLIGDKFISISPGGSEEILQAGDLILETESAVDLEELISKYVFGGV